MADEVEDKVAKQDAAIQAIYTALGQDLQQGVTSTGDIFNTASGNTKNVYDQGLNDVKAITDRLNNRVSASANSLGIGAAVPDSTRQLEESLAASSMRMAGQKTSDLAALAGQGAAYTGIAQQAVGDAGREGARQRSELGTKLRSSILDYMGRKEKARGDVDISRLESEAALQQLRMEIEGRQGEGQLRLRQQQVANQQAAMDRAAAAAQSSGGDPLLDLKAEKLAAEIDKLRGGSGSGSGDTQNVGKGVLGVQAYMKELGIPMNSEEGQALFSSAATEAYNMKKQGRDVSQYDLALSMAYDPNYVGNADVGTLLPLLQIMYGQTRLGE